MIEDEIRQIVLENIEQKESNTEISTETNLQDIGMTSISFISIVVKIEEKFEIEFPDEKLLISEAGTIKSMCDIVTTVLSTKG